MKSDINILEPRDVLVALSHRHENKWDAIFAELRGKNTEGLDASYPTGEELKGWAPITILDKDVYPQKLRDAVAKPPFVLYAKGDLHVFDRVPEALLIVSPREYTHNSSVAAMLQLIAKAGIPGTILWNDPDEEAAGNGYALEALRAYQWAKTPFAVVIGPSCKDPEKVADEVAATGGLAVMESFPGSKRRPDPTFCRIGVGLSKATLVLGGAAKSGSIAAMAVAFALNAGSDVGALSWGALSPNGRFCNELIREGALCVSELEDVQRLLGREPEENA